MPEEGDVYRRLQRHLDRMPVGFPATESGVELRILKHLFTPEEAEIALCLSAVPETLDRIHARLKNRGMTEGELEQALDALVRKGSILGGALLATKSGRKRYSKAMLAIGMYELQVDRLTKAFHQDTLQYLEEGFAEAFHTRKTRQIRTIPINASLAPGFRVGTYDDARRTLRDSAGPFAVLNCICRQGKDLLGEPCRQTELRRTCLALQKVAQACIDSGVAQALTREEALSLLRRAERVGMVLQPQNSRDPLFMCCCCGCCCGVLISAKLFPRPAEFVHSNYSAVLDADQCTGCGTCASRCQMEAVGPVNGATQVDLDRCIGCGLCVATCSSGALRLERRGREIVPPRTHEALYRKIMGERFGLLGTAKIIGKALLGIRI